MLMMAGGEEGIAQVVMRCCISFFVSLLKHSDHCDPARSQQVLQDVLGFPEDEWDVPPPREI